MLDKYKIITVTHRKINLRDIKKFVVQKNGAESIEERLQELKQQFGFEELFYLPTCNRVMYFFISGRPLEEDLAGRFLMAANPHLSNDILSNIGEYAQLFEGMDAIRHLYDVAASIDSLVIGEHQILGQLREAYGKCREAGLSGDSIRLAVQNAILAAKVVYSNTRIGDKPVSVVSLAFQQMTRAHLANDARILVVGAGQTNQLVGKFLAKYHFTNTRIFNRTLEKAEQLAAAIGGDSRAQRLSELPEYGEGFDCLIVCTAATEPVITSELYEKLLRGDDSRKVLIDLSIPHNVAVEVPGLFNVQYIEIEGLRILARENLSFRETEVQNARHLLNQYLSEFPTIYRQRQLERALHAVPDEIKAVKSLAINKVFRKEIDSLDENTRELVDRMLSFMEKKCIGIPMRAAREALISVQDGR